MKLYTTEHWDLQNEKIALLLFAQSMEELFSPFSHDSHKVPVLNVHYICCEILEVIKLVENDILDRGNLIPMIEEFKLLFNQDPIAKRIFNCDFDSLFIFKNVKGEYDKQKFRVENSRDVEAVLPKLKSIASLVFAELERNNQYFTILKNEICTLIKEANQDLLKLDELYQLTRLMASELLNRKYSQSYVHENIIKTFYCPDTTFDSLDILDTFFHGFSFKKKKYVVYLPISGQKQKYAIEQYKVFSIENNIYEMLDATAPYIMKIEVETIDPHNARIQAVELVNFCLSVNHFIKHNKYAYNPKMAEVVDIESHDVWRVSKSPNALACSCGNSDQITSDEVVKLCFGMKRNILQALQLHSSAITSNNKENQLINMWTAVEVAVPVVKKGDLSRINQICNILSTTLCQEYFSILIRQLLTDIRTINQAAYELIQSHGGDESDSEKILEIIFIQSNYNEYAQLIQLLLCNGPILACRLHQYKTRWQDGKQLKKLYRAHSQRLAQQIMSSKLSEHGRKKMGGIACATSPMVG